MEFKACLDCPNCIYFDMCYPELLEKADNLGICPYFKEY